MGPSIQGSGEEMKSRDQCSRILFHIGRGRKMGSVHLRTNSTEPTYLSWHFSISASFVSLSTLLVTAFMTRRPLALLGP